MNQEIRSIVVELEARSREGESLRDTFDRLVRSSEVAAYDRSVVENAKTEARALRILIACAIERSPTKEIRIDRVTQEALNIPGRLAILEWQDFATGEIVYRVEKK